MNQTIEELKTTIAEVDRREWEQMAGNAVYQAAKCRALANDTRAPQVFRDIAAAELETADRKAAGHLQMLEIATAAVLRGCGVADEEAKAEAKMSAKMRTDLKTKQETDELA